MNVSTNATQILEAWNVRGKIFRGYSRNLPLAKAGANLAIMVEHDVTVPCSPCIGLDAGCPQSKCQFERFDGVLL